MPLYLGGSPEIDKNLEAMVIKLKEYLELLTGESVPKVKVVAFALYYTLKTLAQDPEIRERLSVLTSDENALESVNFIQAVIDEFEEQIKPVARKILSEEIKEVSNGANGDS